MFSLDRLTAQHSSVLGSPLLTITAGTSAWAVRWRRQRHASYGVAEDASGVVVTGEATVVLFCFVFLSSDDEHNANEAVNQKAFL